MKLDNMAEIKIKLGSQAVQVNFSEDYKLMDYKKSF